MVIKKILKILMDFIILSLLILLICLIANELIYGRKDSTRFAKINESLTSKEITQEANNQPISKTERSNSNIPLILNTKSISDQIKRESIARSREKFESGSKREKIQALHLLMHISPGDASIIMQELLATLEKTPETLGYIRHLMAGLSEEVAYLQNADLRAIYKLNDPVAQKIAAIILEQRGDGSLTMEFIQSREAKLNSKDSNERYLALQEIGSVGFANANPYFTDALKDLDSNIKLQAIEHLKAHGNKSNISDIERLLHDANNDVVERARNAVLYLWKKDEIDDLPLNRRLMQPGFPASGLVPD